LASALLSGSRLPVHRAPSLKTKIRALLWRAGHAAGVRPARCAICAPPGATRPKESTP